MIENGESGSSVRTKINQLFDRVIDVSERSILGDGSTDNHTLLQALIDDNIGRRIVIGRYPTEVFIVGKPLTFPTGSDVEVNGTLKTKDTSVKSLTADAALGAETISIDNSDGAFVAGQWIIISDDNKPLQAGGAWMTERTSDGNYIESATATTLTLRTPLLRAFTQAANAIVAHGQSTILCDSVENIRISGRGIIDNNSNALARLNPLNENGINESVRQMCCISVDNCSNVRISGGLKLINAALHGLTLHDVDASDIRNVLVDSAHGKSVIAWSLTDCIVDNIFITNAYNEDGFSMYNGNVNTIVTNIHAEGCRRHGFALIGADNENVIVNGLKLKGNYSDLYVQTAENVHVSNVMVTGTHANQTTPVTITDSTEVTFDNLTINGITVTRAFSVSGSSRNVKMRNVKVNEMSSTTAFTVASTSTNIFFEDCEAQDVNYCVEVTGGTPTNVIFRSCLFEDYATGLIFGSNIPKFTKCYGDAKFTKASSTTIPNGSTSVVVSHGLDITPIIQNIKVNSTSTLGSAKHFWVSDINEHNFRINVDADPTQDITLAYVINDDCIIDAESEVTYTSSYESDFSAGVDSWGSTRVVSSGNNDAVDGEDDVLVSYATNVSGTHEISRAAAQSGSTNRITFRFRMPSSQTNVTGFRVYGNTFTETLLTRVSSSMTYDEWVEVTTPEWVANNANIYIRLLSGSGTTSFVGANSAADDLIQIKDIRVEYR